MKRNTLSIIQQDFRLIAGQRRMTHCTKDASLDKKKRIADESFLPDEREGLAQTDQTSAFESVSFCAVRTC